MFYFSFIDFRISSSSAMSSYLAMWTVQPRIQQSSLVSSQNYNVQVTCSYLGKHSAITITMSYCNWILFLFFL